MAHSQLHHPLLPLQVSPHAFPLLLILLLPFWSKVLFFCSFASSFLQKSLVGFSPMLCLLSPNWSGPSKPPPKRVWIFLMLNHFFCSPFLISIFPFLFWMFWWIECGVWLQLFRASRWWSLRVGTVWRLCLMEASLELSLMLLRCCQMESFSFWIQLIVTSIESPPHSLCVSVAMLCDSVWWLARKFTLFLFSLVNFLYANLRKIK